MVIISAVVVTMAAHFATGQGRVTAWILLAEGVAAVGMGVYVICRRRKG